MTEGPEAQLLHEAAEGSRNGVWQMATLLDIISEKFNLAVSLLPFSSLCSVPLSQHLVPHFLHHLLNTWSPETIGKVTHTIREDKHLPGTAQNASLSAQLGTEQSCRDDMNHDVFSCALIEPANRCKIKSWTENQNRKRLVKGCTLQLKLQILHSCRICCVLKLLLWATLWGSLGLHVSEAATPVLHGTQNHHDVYTIEIEAESVVVSSLVQ